jgi:preprotein translocase subunit YajC
MLASLQKGDEVVTAGGLLGVIQEVDDNFVTLEVAPEVLIKIQRRSISTVMPKGTAKTA